MTMTRKRERIYPVEMTISAGAGIIRFKGLPARDDGQPPYALMLINTDHRQLLMRRPKKKSRDAVRMRAEEDNLGSFIIDNCGLFIDRLYRMMTWDFSLDYTLVGAPSDMENAPGLLFDLMDTTALPYERPLPDSARRLVPPEWVERMV